MKPQSGAWLFSGILIAFVFGSQIEVLREGDVFLSYCFEVILLGYCFVLGRISRV